MARKNVSVELPHRIVELEAPVSKTGMLYNSPIPGKQHVLFVPDEPGNNKDLKYRVHGSIHSMADGSFEFIRERSHRSKGTRLATFEYGTFTKTSRDMYLFQVSIPCENKAKLADVISNHTDQVLEVIKGGID